MPRIPIIMPQLGESIAEATIVRLPCQVGDDVDADQEIIEVETNKATMGVTTPCRGKVAELTVELQKTYSVGTVLGYVEVSDEEAARYGVSEIASESGSHTIVSGQSPTSKVTPVVHGLPVPAHAAGISYMSPRMKARMAELGLHAADVAGIAGSGAGGRVTIEDLEDFLYRIDEHQQSPASTMRVAVADAMRRSWTRPLATVGRPVRLDAVLAHRKASNPQPGPALY
ncbi:MAG: biotin/lipoyl-containing protein, partial [Chthoniobacteraceae bacterium]